jgi:hypothetical protein
MEEFSEIKKEFGDIGRLRSIEVSLNEYDSLSMEVNPGFLSQDFLSLKNLFFPLYLEHDLLISCGSIFSTLENEKIVYKLIEQTPYGFLKNIAEPDAYSLLRSLMGKGRIGRMITRISDTDAIQVIWSPGDTETISPLKEIPKLIDSATQSAVAYELDGGRVGDSLISYFHAKWIAMEYGLPFLYRPFPDSESFYLADHDQQLSDYPSDKFQDMVTISRKEDVAKTSPGTLIVVPYFPDVRFEYSTFSINFEYFPIKWNDPKFKQELRKCLQLKDSIRQFQLPKDCFTIAVHVRRGGTWDHYDSISRALPLKFPPYNYYVDQIKQVARLFPGEPLYVYIFTDDLHPEGIASIFNETLQNPLVRFDWYRQGPNSNKLEDFYAMGQFDCLIRAASNFSLFASQLYDMCLVISPTHCYFNRGQIVIDEVEWQFRGMSAENF